MRYTRVMNAPDNTQAPTAQPAPAQEPRPGGRRPSPMLVISAGAVVAALCVCAWVVLGSRGASEVASRRTPSASTSTPAAQVAGLKLAAGKNYGNKFANGMLPVGDGKYETAGAKKGYVYACAQYAQNLGADQGGAGVRGPWFAAGNTEYDINKKVRVRGSVKWQGSFTQSIAGGMRTIASNDLPSHVTGVFPVASSDPAYAVDRNPNSIKAQTDAYSLVANPTYGDPQCAGGQVGIMLTGVPLFSAFDAGGRDAGAWEVQDGCSGHPQMSGEYHYHTLSSCIADTSVSSVIGFALDGFPITGPTISPGNILTTSDLDECHGIVSDVTLDGKKVTTYHYVMTQDFPYSVGCFRAKAFQVTPKAEGAQAQGPRMGPPATRP
jgi:hypothetical protein